MIQLAPRREGTHHRLPWEGHFPIKPWDYRVTVAIPVFDFYDDVALIIELLRLQTIRPFICLIDTGSLPENYLKMEEFRAEDVEVHRLALNGVIHPSDFPALAMELAMSICRSPYLLCTHQDLFLRRRNVIEELLPLAEQHKAVGYHITGGRSHDDTDGMVGHQCLMLNIEAMDKIYAHWNQRRMCTLFGLENHRQHPKRRWWPDTELPLNYMLREAGIQPFIIGHEQLGHRQVDGRVDHCRAKAGATLYHPDHLPMIEAWIDEAREDAQERIEQWQDEPPAKPRLSVITAVSRPQNLPKVAESLELLKPHLDVEWICVADTSKVAVSDLAYGDIRLGTTEGKNIGGGPQKNLGMAAATGDWVWCLDDDNVCLPDFGTVLSHYIRQWATDADMFIFDQVNPDGSLRCTANAENYRAEHIDQAQFVIRKSAIGSAKYPASSNRSDWLFLSELPELRKVFVRSRVTTYNALGPR